MHSLLVLKVSLTIVAFKFEIKNRFAQHLCHRKIKETDIEIQIKENKYKNENRNNNNNKNYMRAQCDIIAVQLLAIYALNKKKNI